MTVTSKIELAEDGHFARPALCVNPPRDSRAVTDEVFGPLATLRGHVDLDEVITAARADRYGLAGYVSGEPSRATEVAQALDVGIVRVNNASPNAPQIPFGGLKHSGLG